MSQQSGFFESRWDETLINPETGTLGDWDLKYYYNQFSEYFSKFFGNGVYYNPDNCLKVIANGGMSLLVKAGWAFIKGFWYELDEDMTLTVPANSTAYERTDSVVLRWNLSNRTITLAYLTDTITPSRTDTVWDLKIAEVIVGAGVAEILGSSITDTRTNQEVCGIVRGLEADAIDTEDLFAQYDAIFNEWFDTVKDQVTGDLGARLQLEFAQLNQNVEEYYENTQDQIDDYNAEYTRILNAANALIQDYVDKDYVIAEQEFVFTNKVCVIQDQKVTANSLIDVYFTSSTIVAAEDAKIYVESGNGTITLTAEVQPTSTIRGMIRVRVRS